jgi:hypothetical protein
MKLLKRITNMSIDELQELQEAVLTEIQRRKAMLSGDPAIEPIESDAATAAPAAAEPDFPPTLPMPSRRVSRNPRRLRRAA